MKNNGYYVVPLFSANYAGVQNDKGVSGDVMIRRQAFELLAEYGYYEGMVPYISNQYTESAKSDGVILSDQYILGKIFAGTYGTMADFKKAMFQRRIEKINRLKPVTITWKDKSVAVKTFEELRLLMNEAVEKTYIYHLPESMEDGIYRKAVRNFARFPDELKEITLLDRYPMDLDLPPIGE